MESSERKFTPPYGIAWRTYLNFLDRFGELEKQGLAPPRIDRSFLGGMSGNDQSYLMSALRGFDQLGPAPENEVKPELVKLATASEKERKAIIADLLRKHYAEAIELAETKETSAKLEEVFRDYGVTGNTMRKAITWFMHAAQYSGLPLSPHWSPPKPARGGVAPGSKRSQRRTSKKTTIAPPSPANGGEGEPSHAITLASGGRVRLSYSVNLFTASTSDRDFVLGLIDAMKDYEAKLPVSDVPEEMPEEPQEVEDAEEETNSGT
jgi:hypothetical protein